MEELVYMSSVADILSSGVAAGIFVGLLAVVRFVILGDKIDAE
jgi:hypothetical protein